VRATLRNIEGLQTYEEENYATKRTDVWGLSDHALFVEANRVLAAQKKPFFSVIQTASNHRPYTIPASDTDFRYEAQTDAELQKNGFASLREFNGFRYLDYSLKKYFEMARKEAYFDNTIFVLFGDHGISGQTGLGFVPSTYAFRGVRAQVGAAAKN
jgi:phosphoglycerol transferase MdoB-like AlkP superfamily enzyme